MKIPAPSASFRPAPAGTHRAVCYAVIDTGTQQDTWQGETKERRKVWICWELSDETMEDGQPFMIRNSYTLSGDSRGNMRKDLEAWRGCPFKDEDFGPDGKFEIQNLIGAACQLQVIHVAKEDGSSKARIASIMAPAKGEPRKVQPKNKTIFLSLEQDEYEPEAYNEIGEWLQAQVCKSPEGQALGLRPVASNRSESEAPSNGHGEGYANEPYDDPDIPF